MSESSPFRDTSVGSSPSSPLALSPPVLSPTSPPPPPLPSRSPSPAEVFPNDGIWRRHLGGKRWVVVKRLEIAVYIGINQYHYTLKDNRWMQETLAEQQGKPHKNQGIALTKEQFDRLAAQTPDIQAEATRLLQTDRRHKAKKKKPPDDTGKKRRRRRGESADGSGPEDIKRVRLDSDD